VDKVLSTLTHEQGKSCNSKWRYKSLFPLGDSGICGSQHSTPLLLAGSHIQGKPRVLHRLKGHLPQGKGLEINSGKLGSLRQNKGLGLVVFKTSLRCGLYTLGLTNPNVSRLCCFSLVRCLQYTG
jgi:hypothetical protein